jgi:hypothetical protein
MMNFEVSTENSNPKNPNSHNFDFPHSHKSQKVAQMNANNNNNNNNNNQVNGVVVVHFIPAMDPSRGGWPPRIQFRIMTGDYRHEDKFWWDLMFHQDRWREARVANARAHGVAVINIDE